MGWALRILRWFMVACLAGMVLLVFGNVILRYIFNSGITESEEFSRWLFVWMIFSGAIVVLHDNAHLGVDIVVNALPRPLRQACLLLTHLLMLYACWLILKGAWLQTMVTARTYAPATGLSLAWFYGIGIVFGLGAGAIIIGRIWGIVTGRIDRLSFQTEDETGIQEARS